MLWAAQHPLTTPVLLFNEVVMISNIYRIDQWSKHIEINERKPSKRHKPVLKPLLVMNHHFLIHLDLPLTVRLGIRHLTFIRQIHILSRRQAILLRQPASSIMVVILCRLLAYNVHYYADHNSSPDSQCHRYSCPDQLSVVRRQEVVRCRGCCCWTVRWV